MKRTKKLILLEDFETQASQKTTTKTEVPTSKKTGEVIRTEVIADVDAILTNLETLSAQITESFINEYNETILINENAGEALLKMFKAMGSLAKLASTYPKMADNKAKLENDKNIFGLKFAEKKEELIAQQTDKAKEAMNAKIDALDDPAQKKQQREMRDTKLEALKTQIEGKIARTKEDKDKKFDRDITDAGSAISKLTGDNKLGDSPILSAKWDALKLNTDRKIEDKYKAIQRKSWDEFIEDPERIAKLEKAAKERAKKDAAENDEQLKKSIERARIAQEKLDTDIQNATGAEKEALEKLNNWNKAYTELNSTLNLTEESTPEEKKAARDASTKLGDAQDKLSKKTMKDAFGYEDDQDADSALMDFTEREEELQTRYQEIKSTIGGGSEDEDEDVDIEAAKEELTTAIDTFKTEIDNLPKNDAGEVNPKDKAVVEVKKFTAEIKLAKINGEDTADLEAKLEQATAVANLAPVPQAGGGEPLNNSLEIPYIRPLVEASVSGLMASDDEEDGYKYLKQQAKKLGVKVSVDKDPWGDGYDELTFTGDKSAVMKLAAISGHDTDINDGAYELSESKTSKTIKLDEGMSISEKFAILMNK